MKTLTLILIIISLNCLAQNNKYTKKFAVADSISSDSLFSSITLDSILNNAYYTTTNPTTTDIGLTGIERLIDYNNHGKLFAIYPVNQIRHAKALPLDGIGFFGIRYNSKILGISERYSEIGSFIYYKIRYGESIREAMLYRVKILVLTDAGQIFYYNFNKQRRGWTIAHGKKYDRFRKQFKM